MPSLTSKIAVSLLKTTVDIGMISDYNSKSLISYFLFGGEFMEADKLFQEFLRLDHQIEEFYHELAVRMGLSDSAFQVLWSMAELGEGCTQRDVCQQFHLSKQTVHSAVRKLEREGILTSAPKSGRQVSLALTEAGRRLVQERVIPAMEAEQAAARRMDLEELRGMIQLTAKWFRLFREEAASIHSDHPDIGVSSEP